jgi:tetratricopeptide (TPR) repeat protein
VISKSSVPVTNKSRPNNYSVRDARSWSTENSSRQPVFWKGRYIQNALGIAYERSNKNREAVRAFESAVRLSPAWALPHLHLGLQFQARGENAAEKEFKMAVNLDPQQPFLRETLAAYYRSRGQYMDAERELNTLVGLRRGMPMRIESWARCMRLHGSTRGQSTLSRHICASLRMLPMVGQYED